MTCTNTSCTIFMTCQIKTRKPCLASRARIPVVQNGYRAMAAQEQQMRMSSIEFKGDF